MSIRQETASDSRDGRAAVARRTCNTVTFRVFARLRKLKKFFAVLIAVHFRLKARDGGESGSVDPSTIGSHDVADGHSCQILKEYISTNIAIL